VFLFFTANYRYARHVLRLLFKTFSFPWVFRAKNGRIRDLFLFKLLVRSMSSTLIDPLTSYHLKKGPENGCTWAGSAPFFFSTCWFRFFPFLFPLLLSQGRQLHPVLSLLPCFFSFVPTVTAPDFLSRAVFLFFSRTTTGLDPSVSVPLVPCFFLGRTLRVRRSASGVTPFTVFPLPFFFFIFSRIFVPLRLCFFLTPLFYFSKKWSVKAICYSRFFFFFSSILGESPSFTFPPPSFFPALNRDCCVADFLCCLLSHLFFKVEPGVFWNTFCLPSPSPFFLSGST